MEMSHVCGRKADGHLFCFTSAAVLISFSQPPGYVMYQKKHTVLYILISFINDMNSQLILMISFLVNFFSQHLHFTFVTRLHPFGCSPYKLSLVCSRFNRIFGASCFASIFQPRCVCNVNPPTHVFALNQSYV